jgi:catechol 2,3-dioxygenase-like lactoylglutathione lyase family enzyme
MIDILDMNHVNITTDDTDRAVEFYEGVLGMKEGKSPAFARRLRWMYIGDQPMVHIAEAEEKPAGGEVAFQHIAFRITNHDTAKARLDELGVEYRVNILDAVNARQLFFSDPDGVEIELIEVNGPRA